MLNKKQLLERIKLLEYTNKTFKSIESMSLNQRTSLQIKLRELTEASDILVRLSLNLTKTLKKEAKKESSRRSLVFIGSENSLCGSYNSQVIAFGKKVLEKLALSFENVKENPEKNLDLILIGRQMKKFLEYINNWKKKINCNVNIYFLSLKDKKNNENKKVLNDIVSLINKNEKNTSFICHNKNGVGQFNFDELQSENKLISSLETISTPVILEGSKQELLKKIEYLLFKNTFHKILFNCETIEVINRLQFIKNSLENCEEEINKNQITYRKLRQGLITQELNELIPGIIQ